MVMMVMNLGCRLRGMMVMMNLWRGLRVVMAMMHGRRLCRATGGKYASQQYGEPETHLL
jgi:hypothetical protein